ncbi:hypothetical protein [Lichenicola sp.]|uniref:hypothetical protein n=1 Tax=Lichenicola sp. TaxID=2804529 RepID=UPI003AFFA9D3
MADPGKPSPLPSLMPFIVMAVLLVVIYGGFLLFPMIKSIINQQDCVATGRNDCYQRSG